MIYLAKRRLLPLRVRVFLSVHGIHGLSSLARWPDAPNTSLGLIRDNIQLNHNGVYRGRWLLSVRSYRSTLSQTGFQFPHERTLHVLTMNDNCFALVEDPLAPIRVELLATAPEGERANLLQNTSHYRTTFLTLRPPGALERLLAQLKAHWVPIRQSGPGAGPKGTHQPGQQLTIDGHIYSIGTDWLVRIANVVMSGGTIRGMLLEAEYLPLPVLRSPAADGTSELLSNLLTSILPNLQEATTVAVTISDSQWEDSLWDREEEEEKMKEKEEKMKEKEEKELEKKEKEERGEGTEMPLEDLYAYGDDIPEKIKGDWTGVDRDRRSAYLIIGALKSEGILL